MKTKLALLETLRGLRSFMAQVPDTTTGWHPTQDKLHYALLDSRWHLVHPDAPAYATSGFSELHDNLGDLSNVSSGLDITGTLTQKRVPVMLATAAPRPSAPGGSRGHPLVFKGMEHDVMRDTNTRKGYQLPGTQATRGGTGPSGPSTPVLSTVQAPPLRIEWGYDEAGNWAPKAVTERPPRSVRWSEKPVAPVGGYNGNGIGLNPSLNQPYNPFKLGETLVPYARQIGAERERWNLPPEGRTANGSTTSNLPTDAYYDADGRYVPQKSVRDEDTHGGTWDSGGKKENVFGWDQGDMEKAPVVASYMTSMLQQLGAPVVPYTTSTIEAMGREGHKDANEQYGKPFFRKAEQQIAVMPFIDENSHLPGERNVGGTSVGDYRNRLAGRLRTGETIMGAPDRHGGNYVEVPMLTPDGNHTMVTHGIDYELPFQNHNSVSNGHGVLQYDPSDPREGTSPQYDDGPQDQELNTFSRQMMIEAGLIQGSNDTGTYDYLGESSRGGLDVLRNFGAANDAVTAPRHMDMADRADKIAAHLDPDSYLHEGEYNRPQSHLYRMWNLMEQQDAAEPPQAREPFKAPVGLPSQKQTVQAGKEAAIDVEDNAAYVRVMKGQGWPHSIGSMIDKETDEALGVMGRGGPNAPTRNDLYGALAHIKRQAALAVPDTQRRDRDKEMYERLMLLQGNPAGTDTMVNAGHLTQIVNLGAGGSGAPPDKQMAVALRHLRYLKEGPPPSPVRPASPASDPAADKAVYDRLGKTFGWGRVPGETAQMADYGTSDQKAILAPRHNPPSKTDMAAALRHVKRAKVQGGAPVPAPDPSTAARDKAMYDQLMRKQGNPAGTDTMVNAGNLTQRVNLGAGGINAPFPKQMEAALRHLKRQRR